VGIGTRPSVYVVQPIPSGSLRRLETFADVEMFPHLDKRPSLDEIASKAVGAQYLFALGENFIDRTVIDVARQLKMIGVMEIFPLSIDLEAATEHAIPVAGLPHSAEITETTAEWTFTLLSALSWRLVEAERLLRDGLWVQYQSNALAGDRLRDRTLGIVGLGAIGRGVARRARASGMHVLYADLEPLPPPEEHDLGISRRDLGDLFAESDVVVLCLSLTEDTAGLIGAELIGRMKPDAILINTARGRVLDESALADALEDGRLRGAALDVHSKEWPEHHPTPNPRLLALPNVIMTPHVGTSARQTREWMSSQVVENIHRHHSGYRPLNVLNPEVYGEPPLRHRRIG
jgi:glyoxylate reductase